MITDYNKNSNTMNHTNNVVYSHHPYYSCVNNIFWGMKNFIQIKILQNSTKKTVKFDFLMFTQFVPFAWSNINEWMPKTGKNKHYELLNEQIIFCVVLHFQCIYLWTVWIHFFFGWLVYQKHTVNGYHETHYC